MEFDRISLEAWQREQPLSVLQLDTADRAVLRVAGGYYFCRVNVNLRVRVGDALSNIFKSPGYLIQHEVFH